MPACRNGTASGISEPRTPVEEANADTTAPMKQSSRAASSGEAETRDAVADEVDGAHLLEHDDIGADAGDQHDLGPGDLAHRALCRFGAISDSARPIVIATKPISRLKASARTARDEASERQIW